MISIVQRPTSKFLEVECKKCKDLNIVFSKSSIPIKCKKCGENLAEPTGGKAIIFGRVKKVLA